MVLILEMRVWIWSNGVFKSCQKDSIYESNIHQSYYKVGIISAKLNFPEIDGISDLICIIIIIYLYIFVLYIFFVYLQNKKSNIQSYSTNTNPAPS